MVHDGSGAGDDTERVGWGQQVTGNPFSKDFTSVCEKWEVSSELEQLERDWIQF